MTAGMWLSFLAMQATALTLLVAAAHSCRFVNAAPRVLFLRRSYKFSMILQKPESDHLIFGAR